MAAILPRNTHRKAGQSSGLTFYEKGLLDRYLAGKWRSPRHSRVNAILHKDWLNGLTSPEAGVLGNLWASDETKRKIRIAQRSRLIARRLGIDHVDVPVI